MDQYTTTTRTSWFSRIGNSIGGGIFGILVFFGAIAMLWWNEGRAVRTAKGLEEGMDVVVSLKSPEVSDKNDGKLVHTTGQLVSQETLSDDEYQISTGGIRLQRVVEMYQWEENKSTKNKKKVGGGSEQTTSYTYKKVWSDKEINSNNFEKSDQYYNPSFSIEPYTVNADQVEMGEFIIPDDLIDQVENFTSIKLDKNIGYKVINEPYRDETVQKYFIGSGTLSSPKIGDMKISFYEVSEGEYSLIAQQSGDSFEPYLTETETHLFMIEHGKHSAKSMFAKAQSNNTVLTWVLRFTGALMMFMAIKMMTQILSTVADIIPFLGTMIDFGLSLFALIISAVVSVTVIGIAWIYYRPLLGISLLIIGAGVTLFFYKKSLDNKRV